jgi:hypothetical protein
MNINKISLLAGIASFIYFLILSIPLIKDIISVKKPIKANSLKSEKWEEMPMMIEK